MKKIFFTILMNFMLLTSMNANDHNVMNTEAYSITVNTETLAKTLDATQDQAECVHDIMSLFIAQMENVKIETIESTRQKMIDNTIEMNTRYMRQVLNDIQYKKYLSILNATLKNRGIR